MQVGIREAELFLLDDCASLPLLFLALALAMTCVCIIAHIVALQCLGKRSLACTFSSFLMLLQLVCRMELQTTNTRTDQWFALQGLWVWRNACGTHFCASTVLDRNVRAGQAGNIPSSKFSQLGIKLSEALWVLIHTFPKKSCNALEDRVMFLL